MKFTLSIIVLSFLLFACKKPDDTTYFKDYSVVAKYTDAEIYYILCTGVRHDTCERINKDQYTDMKTKFEEANKKENDARSQAIVDKVNSELN